MCSCNDMHDVERKPNWNTDATTSKVVVLNEGLFNMNNSTLALFTPATQKIDYNIFKSVNHRGLGDTANDMKRYGSKIYIVVNVSSQIEIIDTATFKSVKQIGMFNEENIARQPRYIVFHEDKAYVSCFDGYVARIDTTTLEIDGMVKCGRNPDNLAIANNKLYVSNSGGLDNPDYDTTVSVIDLATFSEIKKIEVGSNPGSIASDSEGDIYVITRGDYNDTDYALHKIDSEIDEKTQTFKDIHPLNLIINNDIAYMYSYDFNSQTQWIKSFDCLRDEIIKENFITDDTILETPFGIEIDNTNGDLYICEAYNFVNWGDVLCFDKDGKLKFRLTEIGLNPNNIILL